MGEFVPAIQAFSVYSVPVGVFGVPMLLEHLTAQETLAT